MRWAFRALLDGDSGHVLQVACFDRQPALSTVRLLLFCAWLLTLGASVKTEGGVGQLDGRVSFLDIPLLFWRVRSRLTTKGVKEGMSEAGNSYGI